MRVIGAAVLVMESLLMGFAILIAKDNHSSLAIIVGSLISLLLFLNAGLMKNMRGWYIGSVLQIAMVAYGTVVPMMYFMGALFAALWTTGFFIGRKGEAIRAALIAERDGGGSDLSERGGTP
jgi:Protein of unknown function (DUF4233)